MEEVNKLKDSIEPVGIEGIKTILDQLMNCICKIKIKERLGTGFFCKIPYPDDNNLKSFLITNNHVIDESYLNKDKSFEITINNDKIKKN